MPRIPRLGRSAPEAPQAPEAPTDPPTEVTAGDPLADAAPPVPAVGDEAQGDATPDVPVPSGDPLGGSATPAADVAAAEPEAAAPADAATSAALPGDTATTPLPGEAPAPAAATSGDPLGDQPTVVAPPVVEGTPGEDSATVVEEAPVDAAPGFRERARMRRRLRYLRRYRELAFRDLGGLTFDLHRFGRDRPDLVAQKLENLGTVDREVRALETALRERQDVTELREAGIAACPRCQTLHDTDANFCPGCGTALRGAVVRDAAPVTVTPAAQAEPAEQPQPDTAPS